MPGRSGGFSGSSRSPSYSSRSTTSYRSSASSYTPTKSSVVSASTPPTITPTPPTVQHTHHTHQVQQPGFFSNMWQGFGLGAGQSIAMNLFRSDPKVTHVHENAPIVPTTAAATKESFYSSEFSQCMKDKWDDKETCKNYIQCLKDNADDTMLCKKYI